MSKTAPIKTGPYLCISIHRYLNFHSSHYGYPKMQQNIGYLTKLWISVYSTMNIKVFFLLGYPKSLFGYQTFRLIMGIQTDVVYP